MLAYIRGNLVARGSDFVVLEVNGLGMRCNTPLSLAEKLPEIGGEMTLYTHLHWREDGPQLYGFAEVAELELFQRLISVSGIGPKVALGVLGYASPARILTWLIYEDYTQLRRIPGVGLKTAQRLVLELKEKAASLVTSTGTPMAESTQGAADSPGRQALEALVTLGFDSSLAARILAEVQVSLPQITLEQLITEALRRLASR
ncbi:MAG: Holliday junction branch migration protein RuvA [Symbiobacteriaceae bacterium]|nr:Holliday junction branch migration protein RuvA [Symbiobacteriaceae bacterium]